MRYKCKIYLFSSNLDALCFIFFKIHMIRDTPVAKAVAPAATPVVITVAGAELAVETL